MQNRESTAQKKYEEAVVPSPFFLDGFLEYNKKRWGLEIHRETYMLSKSELPRLDVVMYLDKKGRICLPLWVSHMAIRFESSPTNKKYRANRQWLDLANRLVEDMHKRGISGPIVLPPDILDVRPFKWGGFNIDVRYSYILDLPFSEADIDNGVRSKIKKATANGYRCSRSTDMYAVIECFAATEARNGFDLQLTASDLNDLRDLVGDDVLRVYACFDENNEMVSVDIALYDPGSPIAIGWLGGTKIEHLRTGAVQLLYKSMFEDLAKAGATSIDLTGANIRSVAAMKADWGGRLVSYYVIESHDFRALYVWIKKAIKQRLKKRGG